MNFEQLLESEINALSESSLSRIQSKTVKYDTGAVTAFRGDKDIGLNKSNNRKLKAYLMKKGYSVTAVKGSYIEDFGSATQREVSEPSYFVADIKETGKLQKDLEALGRLFDQDSILFVPKGGKDAYLVGTTKRPDAWLSIGQKQVVGSSKFGKAAGEFLSRVNNREFAFESAVPLTINGLRSMHMLAENVTQQIQKMEKAT
ncbi:hypothetical protein [Alishewanella phage vB_AspM_Slicko01]|nr:hypothetical protein [Alishewanella phage vB_AspM_Slicko01]